MVAQLLYKQNSHHNDYIVHGICRKNSINLPIVQAMSRINSAGSKRLRIHFGDVTDAFFMLNLIKEVQPDEIYNLAAQS